MYEIDEATIEIKRWHKRWAQNRAFVDGEQAVKDAGELYLPKARVDDSDNEYAAHKDRTGFFPAAFKITQGWLGLIFRKPTTIKMSSTRLQLLAQVFTRESLSMADVSAWLVRETMITNFVGHLVDSPDRRDYPDNMSEADELRRGFRPYVARYIGENILEVTRGFIDNLRVGLVHVRLLEDDGNTVRQLLINDSGFYEVRIHQKVGGTFRLVTTSVPTRNGEPLREIPFTLINTDDSIVPTPSLIQHCVDLNLQHYRVEGMLAAALQLTSGPIAVIKGFTPEEDPVTKKPVDVSWDVSSGAVWEFKESTVEVDWFIYDPKGQELVINKLRDLKDAMSAIGHSVLAPEKPAPEAAETQLIRRAAENAMLAAFTKKVSDRLQVAYRTWALWADPQNPGLEFSLNLDFLPQALSPQVVTAFSSLVEKRQLSLETFHEVLNEGELMPMGFDPEIEAERLANETADRPPVF